VKGRDDSRDVHDCFYLRYRGGSFADRPYTPTGRRRKYRRKRLPLPMPNESKTPEEYVSNALDLMVKARWVKQHGGSVKELGVDWTDRGKLAMEALGYMIEDLGPENLNQELWWAVGTLANMKFTSPS
jgi:hypothetical protein